MLKLVVCAALLALAVALPVQRAAVKPEEYSFEMFKRDYGKQYDGAEHERRSEVFAANMAQIVAHNKGTSTWKMGPGPFTDLTKEEFAATRLGLASVPRLETLPSRQPPSKEALAALPTSVDWREKGVITDVKDQGGCGSCYAHASVEQIESYVALNSTQLMTLSTEQITACTPNPQSCGGTGGCGGNVPEIVFDYVVNAGGITTEWMYPYTSFGGDVSPCAFNNSASAPAVAQIDGFIKLLPNNVDDVMNTLATVGPLAVNVQANVWQHYSSGVFDGCNNESNIDIDHVVQLVGYGTDATLGDYFLVRNSWDTFWGENGYIRLARPASVQCGTDPTPLDGTGCKGGPPTQHVCGQCGILFDASYPTGARSLR